MTIPNLKIDYVVINAGVLKYPNVCKLQRAVWIKLILTSESD